MEYMYRGQVDYGEVGVTGKDFGRFFRNDHFALSSSSHPLRISVSTIPYSCPPPSLKVEGPDIGDFWFDIGDFWFGKIIE